MPTLATWATPRLSTLKAIAVGIGTWPLAMVVAWAAVPVVTPSDRLSFALQFAAVPSVVLFAMLQSLWRIFDTPEAENPLAGGESRRYRVNARVLQNTLEQGAIFVPVLVALTLRVPEAHVRWMPVLLAVWTVGRLLFWAGYHVHPAWRAPGMDWTTLTASLAVGWLVWTWV